MKVGNGCRIPRRDFYHGGGLSNRYYYRKQHRNGWRYYMWFH